MNLVLFCRKMHFKSDFLLIVVILVCIVCSSAQPSIQFSDVPDFDDSREKDVSSFSHLAQVTDQGRLFLCFGMLINDFHIITSAHCIPKERIYQPEKIRVYLGYRGIPNFDKQYKVNKIIIHPGYYFNQNSGKVIFDLAILEMFRNITLPDTITPISFVNNEDIKWLQSKLDNKNRCRTMKWEVSTRKIYEISIQLLNSYDCPTIRHMDNKVEFCGRNYENSKCLLDIGAPIICDKILYGLHLWTPTCDDDRHLFTRLDMLYSFIDKTIGWSKQFPTEEQWYRCSEYETNIGFIKLNNLVKIFNYTCRETNILGSGIFLSNTLFITSKEAIKYFIDEKRKLKVGNESVIYNTKPPNSYVISKMTLLKANNELVFLRTMNETIVADKNLPQLPIYDDSFEKNKQTCFTLVLKSKKNESINFTDPQLLSKMLIKKIPITLVSAKKCEIPSNVSNICVNHTEEEQYCPEQGSPLICGNTLFGIKVSVKCNQSLSTYAVITNVKPLRNLLKNIAEGRFDFFFDINVKEKK